MEPTFSKGDFKKMGMKRPNSWSPMPEFKDTDGKFTTKEAKLLSWGKRVKRSIIAGEKVHYQKLENNYKILDEKRGILDYAKIEKLISKGMSEKEASDKILNSRVKEENRKSKLVITQTKKYKNEYTKIKLELEKRTEKRKDLDRRIYKNLHND